MKRGMKNKIYLFLLFAALCLKVVAQSEATDTVHVDSWEEARTLLFGLLPHEHYPSGYLLDRGSVLPKMTYANGELSDSSFNMPEWYFILNTIKMGYNNTDSIIGYVSLDSIKNKYIEANDILPFGLIDMNTQIIRDSAITDGSLTLVDYRFTENTSDLSKIYVNRKVFCLAPLNMEVYTMNPQFILMPDYVFSNNTHSVVSMEIDLDDNSGYKAVSLNVPFQASYQSGGYKIFTARAIYSNGDTLYSRSELNIIDNNILDVLSTCYTPPDYTYVRHWGAGTYGGDYPAQEWETEQQSFSSKFAEVGVWYGCGNTEKKVRKPLVIFAGYNPKNGKALFDNGNAAWINDLAGPLLALDGWRGPLYQTYDGFFTDISKNSSLYGGNQNFGSNGNRMLDKIRQEGYDIFIVRFHDGIGHLQASAYLTTLVIKDINKRILNEDEAVTNPGAALDPEAPGYPNTSVIKKAKHELIVMGYSAGALGTRLALTLMEYEQEKYKCADSPEDLFKKGRSTHHRTKIWVCFDHEAQGSNVPIGQQMFMDFQKSMQYFPGTFADILNSIICSQALDLMNENGVATQNTLYNLKSSYHVGNGVWNVLYHNDFYRYFLDLTYVSTLPVNRPANLSGYPLKCYRIAISQGSANGILQTLTNDNELLYYQSPKPFCPFSMNLPVKGYRKARAYALTPNNNIAFTCAAGIAVNALLFNFFITVSHPKYKSTNYIQDGYLAAGQWRSLDADPGSTLPAHMILGKKLLPAGPTWYNTFFACAEKQVGLKQTGFAPTVSGLDLHQPGNNSLPRLPEHNYLIPGNVSGGLNLMQQNKYNIGNNNSPNNDFGYPHLTFPNNHNDYTPFDALWANNREDDNYDWNTMHVEDPNPHIGDFLVEEIAPHTLYLSNRNIGANIYTCGDIPFKEKYYADFEARNSLLAGNQSIYQSDPNPNNWSARQRTTEGDFVVQDGGIVTFRANNYDGQSKITLGAGFSAKHGSIFRAYVYTDPNICPPFNYENCAFRPVADNPAAPPASRPIYSKRATAQKMNNELKKINLYLYPNPSSGSITYILKEAESYEYVLSDLTGKIIQTGMIAEKINNINLSYLEKGIYLITVSNKNYKRTDRIILQ